MSSSQKILVVENHPDVARVFAFMLKSRGHTATVVPSLAEAKETLGRESFDLVVCDYRLDDGEGIELMEWLRERDHRPVSICVSGFGEDAAERCLSAGFDGFITKPVDMNMLEAKFAAALGKRHKTSGDGMSRDSDGDGKAR